VGGSNAIGADAHSRLKRPMPPLAGADRSTPAAALWSSRTRPTATENSLSQSDAGTWAKAASVVWPYMTARIDFLARAGVEIDGRRRGRGVHGGENVLTTGAVILEIGGWYLLCHTGLVKDLRVTVDKVDVLVEGKSDGVAGLARHALQGKPSNSKQATSLSILRVYVGDLYLPISINLGSCTYAGRSEWSACRLLHCYEGFRSSR
jgi:hypothetical protein